MLIKNFWQKNYKKVIPFLILGIIVLIGHFVFTKNSVQTTTIKTTAEKSTQTQTTEQEATTPKTPAEEFATENIKTLQKQTQQNNLLTKQVGQMLILGFRGTQYQENSFIDKAIKDLKISGVVLFDIDAPSGIFPRNIVSPEQVKKLTTELQQHSATPLLVSIDVEGGLVNRLKSKYGFMEVPSATELGKGTPENTFQIAKKLGEQLKNLGINFDFAPVVDLNINPQNPIIGKLGRSFSDNPDIVIAQAESFINGLTQSNIITSIKYFPGHGSSQTDSHQGITDVTNTYQAKELIPFQDLIKKNIVRAVMVAHTFNKNLDENYPATMSVNTIQKTLKDLVGFNGVVVCDDLSMGAISQNYGLAEAAVKMVEAGCDLLIISNNVSSYDETLPYQVQNAILQATNNGEIATSSIEASYNKIIKLKNDFKVIK
ncbi:MAG: glycoside hydrolase family 3 N-terminal domain-containing protein [Candidatus Pacebacteria bacterium]|nr:glycoside hydrolase family 3 N-terminal domain-containing protein [Candidatus Paceibacterota bacterium]